LHMPHSASIALNLARYLRRNEPFAYLGLPNTRLLSQDICLKPAQAGMGEPEHRKRPRHGTLPFGSRGGVCITIRAAVSTGAHDTLLQEACAAPFCKRRRCCASLRVVLRSVKLMRVIFPTRGGINRLSRLTRLPASAPQDHLIGGSSLFSALCPGFDKSASWRSPAQKGKKHADFSTRFSKYIVSHCLYGTQVQ
jgi:hypothetical protein